MNCKRDNELVIPRGNDFKIHICLADVVPSAPSDKTFTDVDNLQAYIVRFPGVRTSVGYELTETGDLLILVPAEVQLPTKYGIELTGTYNGNAWRFKCVKVFRLSDSNCESNVQGMETFGVETYYFKDVLWVDVSGDTLDIISDGHAWIDGDVLHLQDTEETEISFRGSKMIVTQLNN